MLYRNILIALIIATVSALDSRCPIDFTPEKYTCNDVFGSKWGDCIPVTGGQPCNEGMFSAWACRCGAGKDAPFLCDCYEGAGAVMLKDNGNSTDDDIDVGADSVDGDDASGASMTATVTVMGTFAVATATILGL